MNISEKKVIFYIIWVTIIVIISLMSCSRYYYNQGYIAGYNTCYKNLLNVIKVHKQKCIQINNRKINKNELSSAKQ